MELVDSKSFLEKTQDEMFYVGFMKSGEAWFPLCFISDPAKKQALDTLPLSPTYPLMEEMLKEYSRQIPEVEQTFVQYLMAEEIKNLLERYSLEKIVLISREGEDGGCGCGCDCG